MFTEARNDAKLNSLPPEQHRVWFKLLCFAAEQMGHRGAIVGYDNDILSIEVSGGDVELLEDTLKRLQRLRIISIEGDTITFINFAERQARKQSDEPEAIRERVAEHRRRKKSEDVTPSNALQIESNAMKRDGNAVEVEEEREEELTITKEGESKKPTRGSKQTSSLTVVGDNFTEFFNTFWDDYPRDKEGLRAGTKSKARDALRKISVSDWDLVTQALANYKTVERVQRGYVLNAERWLSNDKWRDFLEARRIPEVTNGQRKHPKDAAADRFAQSALALIRGAKEDDPAQYDSSRLLGSGPKPS